MHAPAEVRGFTEPQALFRNGQKPTTFLLEKSFFLLAFLITERQLEMTLLKLKLGGCAYYARLFPASLDGQSTTGA